MKARLALVIWWLGAILGGASVLFGLWAACFGDGIDSGVVGGAALAFGVVVALPAWAVAFVLAGSFWRPPRSA